MAVINLAVGRKPYPIIIDVVQYATAPDITFILEDYTPPTGASGKVYIKKPSGAKVYNNAPISNNTITYTPTTQAFAETGDNVGQLEIVSGTKVLYSFPLVFRVAENIVDSAAIESQDDFTALQEAVGTVSQYDGRITTNANAIEELSNTVGAATVNLNGRIVGDNVAIPHNAITSIGDFTLTPGVYIMKASVRFNSNATGYRGLILSDVEGSATALYNQNVDWRNAISGRYTSCAITSPISITQTTTIYVNVFQNSGGDLNASGRLSVMRIK